jgi:hypothetical protein
MWRQMSLVGPFTGINVSQGIGEGFSLLPLGEGSGMRAYDADLILELCAVTNKLEPALRPSPNPLSMVEG